MGECFFWYWPTRVVPDKGPLNGCVCVSLKYLSVTAEMKLILTLLCCNCFPFQLACCTVYIVHALYQLTCMLKDSVMISWVFVNKFFTPKLKVKENRWFVIPTAHYMF